MAGWTCRVAAGSGIRANAAATMPGVTSGGLDRAGYRRTRTGLTPARDRVATQTASRSESSERIGCAARSNGRWTLRRAHLDVRDLNEPFTTWRDCLRVALAGACGAANADTLSTSQRSVRKPAHHDSNPMTEINQRLAILHAARRPSGASSARTTRGSAPAAEIVVPPATRPPTLTLASTSVSTSTPAVHDRPLASLESASRGVDLLDRLQKFVAASTVGAPRMIAAIGRVARSEGFVPSRRPRPPLCLWLERSQSATSVGDVLTLADDRRRRRTSGRSRCPARVVVVAATEQAAQPAARRAPNACGTCRPTPE